MTDEWTVPLTVEQLYDYWDVDWDDAVALTDRSLDPRPSSAIFDILATLGPGTDDVVLDIGGRDAEHGLIIAERFGCRVIVVDPAQENLDLGAEAIAEHEHGERVEIHGDGSTTSRWRTTRSTSCSRATCSPMSRISTVRSRSAGGC